MSADWPRNAFGDLLCTKTKPMPINDPQAHRGHTWAHQAKTPAGDAAFHCPDCGHHWTVDQ